MRRPGWADLHHGLATASDRKNAARQPSQRTQPETSGLPRNAVVVEASITTFTRNAVKYQFKIAVSAACNHRQARPGWHPVCEQMPLWETFQTTDRSDVTEPLDHVGHRAVGKYVHALDLVAVAAVPGHAIF